MKLYLLTNMYCDGTHPGIQGIHSAVRLVTKYVEDRDWPELTAQVDEWVEKHETAIILQSGLDHSGLKDLVESIDQETRKAYYGRYKDDSFQPKHPLVPFAYFEEPGMNYSITSVAVLCDSMMVSQMGALRKGVITVDMLVKNYGEVLGNLLNNMAYMRLA